MGIWPPELLTQLAVLNALNAVAWLALASPKLHNIILSSFKSLSEMARSLARSTEKAAPTAFGR